MHLSPGRRIPRAEHRGVWFFFLKDPKCCKVFIFGWCCGTLCSAWGLLHWHRACYLSGVRTSSSLLRIISQGSLQLCFYPGLLLSLQNLSSGCWEILPPKYKGTWLMGLYVSLPCSAWDFPLLLNCSGCGLLKLTFPTNPGNYIFSLAPLVISHSHLQLSEKYSWAETHKAGSRREMLLSQRPLNSFGLPWGAFPQFWTSWKAGVPASTMSEGWPGMNDGDIIPSSGRNICHSRALGEAFQDSVGL